MHILVIAWLYVIAMVAMTASSLLSGAVLFVIAGLGPVLLIFGWAVRRSRAARRARSGLEQHVDEGDDGDA